jgi:hypothetical protein
VKQCPRHNFLQVQSNSNPENLEFSRIYTACFHGMDLTVRLIALSSYAHSTRTLPKEETKTIKTINNYTRKKKNIIAHTEEASRKLLRSAIRQRLGRAIGFVRSRKGRKVFRLIFQSLRNNHTKKYRVDHKVRIEGLYILLWFLWLQQQILLIAFLSTSNDLGGESSSTSSTCIVV